MSRRWNSQGSGRVNDVDIERQAPKNDGTGSDKKTTIKMAIGQAVNYPLMIKIISKMKEIISKMPWWFQYFHWDVMFLVLCVVTVAVDPLFFYLPVINEATKCITIDTTLEITAICVRSFLDLVAFGNLVARRDYMMSSDYVINILAILPVPQVLVPLMFSEMSGSKFRNIRRFLNVVVLSQYVPRILRIYRLWRKVNETIILPKSIPSTTSTSTVKAVNAEGYKNMMKNIPPKGFIVMKGGFNLFLYLVASHVLGAFWYFFSIERETTCWHVACEPHQTDIGCIETSFNCDAGFGNHTILNDYCSLEKKTNTTLSFDFGIFQDARQSGILASMDFPRKTMFCFWWGLRNLSSLGQNLETSSDYWENCFTVLISVFGLLLFLYFIGNLQMPIFKNESEELLYEITCKFLKQVQYNQNSYIVREGEPLDAMIFVVKGIVWMYTSNHDDKTDCLKKGDIFGRNLVEWVLETPELSDLPLSTMTLKCHTKVEAFCLMVGDLKDMISQYWWRFSKFRHITQSDSKQLKHFAASSIQAAWRRNAILHPH
ncbi:hypothetical protein F2P56_034933 [Juglans regia]|uniref:Cyclic nucleotide-binding domain-containing protein n=1 Tax=Juglans regia TaxID=51240 RepID=A0A833WBB1_JUGRE|nr:hypothetical protein F2P56_034933 [Juglans regia]